MHIQKTVESVIAELKSRPQFADKPHTTPLNAGSFLELVRRTSEAYAYCERKLGPRGGLWASHMIMDIEPNCSVFFFVDVQEAVLFKLSSE
ncbi:hypothetical protein [Teichococcus vastitatis]|uniref:Uncharacterized protein n=1 Tax=Teichococcus vastitatis TaxID=2307076 RepID=A0ABS9WCT0_9PROT|nr:hypothetical protein [Pseudoroseomonas vastitatis]MCI0756700.1 hypothetical protein [Pseudoroseomonas vastitatis]